MSIAYTKALENLKKATYSPPPDLPNHEPLLKKYHPDHFNNNETLSIGPNKGEKCHPILAQLLQSNPLISDLTIAGAMIVNTQVLIIGSGGAGCTAALEAADKDCKVAIVTKLRTGDSNTVMAEGGIQAATGNDDSPQTHFEDTLRAGHHCGDPKLVAKLSLLAPESIKWLIDKGMRFDMSDDHYLVKKRAGGATKSRILSFKDCTGLELMRVLRESVKLNKKIDVLENCPLIELLSDEQGNCVGGVVYNFFTKKFIVIRASRTILATGGSGRLHLNDFPTSNHYGATADGLILAYRMGAKLRDIDSFQYHPTGVAWPSFRYGGLISEAVRSSGAFLINGLGERFIDELKPRDVVSAAILKECSESRGVVRENKVGVFLDIPHLVKKHPNILDHQLVSLKHLGKQCNLDLTKEPMIVTPTLHYQNGGILIDENGLTNVPNLYAIGEVSGGIHGKNRMMGNALQEIITFGRITGQHAAETLDKTTPPKAGLFHLYDWQREIIFSGVQNNIKAPILFPEYSNFNFNKFIFNQESK